MRFEEYLRTELGCESVKGAGGAGGGCISQGQAYELSYEDGSKQKVYVKRNSQPGAKLMFDGEFASLKAMRDTKTIRVPEPIKVLSDTKHGSMLVMEFLENLGGLRSSEGKLGEQLARMHLHENSTVTKFGFHTPTCCGSIPQSNGWCEDWPTFYASKLQEQMDLLDKSENDSEARGLWNKLKPKIPQFFPKDQDVKPSLLHGDLWSGNAASINGEPVIFDAASFYGHHEYDLGIAKMFGGFGSDFYNAYHNLIPKAPGFAERNLLYRLFHNLNHWNHFGGGYRSGSLEIMRRLMK